MITSNYNYQQRIIQELRTYIIHQPHFSHFYQPQFFGIISLQKIVITELILLYMVICIRNFFYINIIQQIIALKSMEMFQKPLISIAPMLDVTNTHFRYFMRLLTKQATLYTQMIHHNAILHNPQPHLKYNQIEHPLVLQLGGSDPQKLGQACIVAKKYGYDQINLNVGCPSPRVQYGSFGACLMKQKQIVANCMKQMKKAINGEVPTTVKCRLGVDQFDSYQFVSDFIKHVSVAGQVKHFVIHARKAYLKGLNPAQNRNIPPLRYQQVYKLIQDFPDLQFSINGGIKTIDQASKILQQHPKMYGCMIGRTAYEDPYNLVNTDQIIYKYKDRKALTRYQILDKYAQYVEQVQNSGNPANCSVLVKPIINLFHGQKYCAKYRQLLSDTKKMKKQGTAETIRETSKKMYDYLNKKNQNEQKIINEKGDQQNMEKIQQEKIQASNNLA